MMEQCLKVWWRYKCDYDVGDDIWIGIEIVIVEWEWNMEVRDGSVEFPKL